MKTALVTGGCGFIGSYLCKKLKKRGYNVICIDKLSYATKYSRNFAKYDMLYTVDLQDFDTLNNVIKNIYEIEKYHINVIFHLAAESHVDNSINSPKDFTTNNIVSTINILEIAKQYSIPFVNISTDEVYGTLLKGQNFGWSEFCTIDPTSPYSASKASSDLICLSYFKTYNMDIKITRCCNNFGSGQHIEKLIPKSIITSIEENKIYIYGDGENIREWIHVDDHCEGIILVYEKGVSGEIYNIGSDNSLSNNGIAKIIQNQINADIEIEYIADRKAHDFKYMLNSSKIKKLGFIAKKSILNLNEWNKMVSYYKKYTNT